MQIDAGKCRTLPEQTVISRTKPVQVFGLGFADSADSVEVIWKPKRLTSRQFEDWCEGPTDLRVEALQVILDWPDPAKFWWDSQLCTLGSLGLPLIFCVFTCHIWNESVPKRYLFRMTYYKNLESFLIGGAEFAKNSPQASPRYRISFDEIVARRGTVFSVPSGSAVNEFVPFYFSPSTKMAYSIHMGNVPLKAPDDKHLGPASMDDVAFMIVDPSTLFQSGRECWYTDQACNSAITPLYENDPSKLAQHIAWPLFDEPPTMAIIPELEYRGVCQYQHDRDIPPYQQRSKKRMAEFLVKDHLRMDELSCIVLKSAEHRAEVEAWVQQAELTIPVLVKPGCYF